MLTYRQASPKKQILGIGGSPRKKGNSDVLLEHILMGVQEKAVPHDQVQLRELDFQACVGCERCRKDKKCTGLKDELQPVYSKIIDSQGLILISPAHTYNVTAMMKAFIDRMYTFYNFGNDRPRSWTSQLAGQNRKALLVGIAEQTNKKDMGFTIEAMRLSLDSLGYEIVDELEVYGIFDRGKVSEKSEILAQAKGLGTMLAQSIIE